MKVYTSELEFLRDEVEKCHESMHSQIQMLKDLMANRHELQEKLENQQKRTWIGLTNEDIALIDWESLATKKDCAQAIEAKLKEKNCG